MLTIRSNSPANTLSLTKTRFFTKSADYSSRKMNFADRAIIQNKKDMEDEFSRMCNQSSRDQGNSKQSADKFEELKRERGIVIKWRL